MRTRRLIYDREPVFREEAPETCGREPPPVTEILIAMGLLAEGHNDDDGVPRQPAKVRERLLDVIYVLQRRVVEDHIILLTRSRRNLGLQVKIQLIGSAAEPSEAARLVVAEVVL